VSRYPLSGALTLLIALTILLTWPQALHLGTKVAAHDDPLFSIWRLAWVAHSLPLDPQHVFDANIFHPHLRTLAYSDAMLFESLLAAPWLWAQVNPILVYNVLLLAAIVSSGMGMFVLVRHLTGDPDAALVSAVIFTLLPYRIEHFMHLELQWTVWMPLAFWAVHRAIEERSVRFGLLAGLLIWLQMISSVYYGAFLSVIVAALAGLLVASKPQQARGVRGVRDRALRGRPGPLVREGSVTLELVGRLGQLDLGIARYLASIDVLQRIRPETGFARLALDFVLVVLGLDIDGARPVLRGFGELELVLDPVLELEFLYSTVEILDLDRAILRIDRHYLEGFATALPVPAADDGCRVCHCLSPL